MVFDRSRSLGVGTLVSLAPAPGHRRVDLYAAAPVTLVTGTGEPLTGYILTYVPEEITVAVGDNRVLLTPVAATLEEGPSLDYQGAWVVQAITPLGGP